MIILGRDILFWKYFFECFEIINFILNDCCWIARWLEIMFRHSVKTFCTGCEISRFRFAKTITQIIRFI